SLARRWHGTGTAARRASTFPARASCPDDHRAAAARARQWRWAPGPAGAACRSDRRSSCARSRWASARRHPAGQGGAWARLHSDPNLDSAPCRLPARPHVDGRPTQGGEPMPQDLTGKKIAILVADGFEQSEMTEPRKALDRAGAETILISPSEGKVKAWQHTDWGDEFPVDMPLQQANADDFDALVLPGGVFNPD